MKMVTKISLAALLTGALISGFAIAQAGDHGRRHSPTDMIERLDSDGDGVLTAAELTEGAHHHVTDADADGDGLITAEEFEAAALTRIEEKRRSRIDKAFRHLDEDGDGVISEAEIEARQADRFARLDEDGDGVVSAEELENMRSHHHHGRRHGRGGRHGDTEAGGKGQN